MLFNIYQNHSCLEDPNYIGTIEATSAVSCAKKLKQHLIKEWSVNNDSGEVNDEMVAEYEAAKYHKAEDDEPAVLRVNDDEEFTIIPIKMIS